MSGVSRSCAMPVTYVAIHYGTRGNYGEEDAAEVKPKPKTLSSDCSWPGAKMFIRLWVCATQAAEPEPPHETKAGKSYVDPERAS